MKTRRALVTGGAGFLGSHLCDGLLGEGYAVMAADNLLTGRLANLEHLRNDSRFEFVEKDVCQPGEWGALDYVFHFASPASPVDYAEHGIETLRVGSYGTFEALETALRCGAKFMMASTSECYGDPLVHPQTETLLGECESDRTAVGVRRGQAVFRGGDHGVSPLSSGGYADSAHLQYLRAADADQ
jgi:dTDP-glucose 4,6-dehydratase